MPHGIRCHPPRRRDRFAPAGRHQGSRTRWSAPVLGEEWVEVDFRQSRPLRRLTLDQTSRTAKFPEKHEVHVTDDPKQPGQAVVTGAGKSGKTVIELPVGTKGRYVMIKNTAERNETPWAICELYVD